MQQLHGAPTTDVDKMSPAGRPIDNQHGTCTIHKASRNVKNVGTNLNFVKYLAKTAPVIFLQETWLTNS